MKDNKKTKVAVAMSGGVDSSVAAYLLQKQGYDVAGFFMKFWFEDGVEDKRENRCCTLDMYNDVGQVCRKLDIPFYTLNFESKFKEDIVDDFLGAYAEGLTPNPCIRCNQFVKFGEFYSRAKELGFDYISTGHYSNIHQDSDGKFYISSAKDSHKDQTYFLYRVNQEILSHTLFPVGKYTKPEIREIAAEQGFNTAEKKGSQDLCFVANNDLKGFLSRHMSFEPGDIIDIETNEVLGTHEGLQSYTIGQRKGIGLGGGPWYVVKKNMSKNQLFVTKNRDHEEFLSGKIELKDVHWVAGQAPKLPGIYYAKTRYNQPLAEVEISEANNKTVLNFKEPRRAVTPGQSAVWYKDDKLVGGGVIENVIK